MISDVPNVRYQLTLQVTTKLGLVQATTVNVMWLFDFFRMIF